MDMYRPTKHVLSHFPTAKADTDNDKIRKWIDYCPVHEMEPTPQDHHPSLHITEFKETGQLAIRCVSKHCDFNEILKAKNLEPKDLNPSQIPRALNKVLSSFFNPEKFGDEWRADCPLCKEHSLLIMELEDTVILPKCEGGCDRAMILLEVGLKISDLKLKKSKKPSKKRGQFVCSYEYQDEKGSFRYGRRRYNTEEGKEFYYFHHAVDKGVIKEVWGKNNEPSILYNLPELVDRRNEDVHIPEGEKDVETLRKQNYVATSFVEGAMKWKFTSEENRKWLLGRDRVILYEDNDDTGRQSTYDKAVWLCGKVKEVKVITPELLALKHPKEDITDWFEKYDGTKELLNEIINRAPRFDKYKVIKDDIKAGKSSIVLLSNYDKAMTELEKIWFLNKTEDNKDMIAFVNWQGIGWQYKKGYYKNRRQDALKSMVWKTAAACKIQVKMSKVTLADLIPGAEDGFSLSDYPIDIKRQKELHNALMSRNLLDVDEDVTLPYWLTGQDNRPLSKDILVIRNGYLDISDVNNIVLKPSTPELFSPSIINVNIDPKNPPPKPELFFEWLKDWLVDDDAIRESQKWSGYCMISNFLFKSMLCLLGFGDSAKTTWLYHLQAILGPSYLGTDVNQLGQEHGLANAPGKLIVAIDDAFWFCDRGSFGQFITNLKKISGGSPVTIRQMRNDPFDMLLFAKLIFASDEPPSFSDPGGQFATRWRYLKFLFDKEAHIAKNKKVYSPEEHRALLREMKAAIFWHYSIPGIKMLIEDKGFHNPANVQDILTEVKERSRPLLTFFEECCVKGPSEKGFQVRTADVFIQWKEYCEKNNLKMLPSFNDQRTFTKDLKRFVKGITSKREWFYGFKLKIEPDM